MQNRTRKEQLIIRVTPEEKAMIQTKMKQMGTTQFSRYARKMLIDGWVLSVDLSEFNKLAVEVHKIGVNINQVARAVNSNGVMYSQDMDAMRKMVEEAWQLLKLSLSTLLSISQ